jgi:hypothetical protein
MMQYPILKPGTLAKPQTRDGRFQWMQIIDDPGPAHDHTRRITLQDRRGNPVIVRRDRVTLGTLRSIFDSTLAPASTAGATPPPGDKRANADAGRKPRAMKMMDRFAEGLES